MLQRNLEKIKGKINESEKNWADFYGKSDVLI